MAVQKTHAQWSSRWAFMLAAVGSAVGLGNIWKFPYEAGSGGGGAFVIVYLLFVFLIGTPLLVAELSLGRRGQQSPIGSMRKIAGEEGRSRWWQIIGWSGVVGAFVVLSFYSVVGGWTLSYMVDALVGTFSNIDAAGAARHFQDNTIGNELRMIAWHAVFMGITLWIVGQGVEGGLEKAVVALMPALFLLLIILVAYSAASADFGSAVVFLFEPDFTKLTVPTVLEALGQSFFSLSLALGSIMTYGSYLNRDVSIGQSAVVIASADTLVALLAGLAIFPIVFSYGLDVGGGPGLIFVSLPIAFGQMPLGVVIGTLFFALLAVAAITSSISLLEPAVSFIDENTNFKRRHVAIVIGLAAFGLGVFSALGQQGNSLGHITLFGMGIMDLKDYVTNNIMMPLGGLFTAVFVGWFVARKKMMEELALAEPWFRVWYFLIRFVCPVAVAAVFISVAFL